MMMKRERACLPPQDEAISFFEASERLLMLGEVLLGWVEFHTGATVCNPPDKAARILDRARVDVFVTVAWGGGAAQPGDWEGSD